MAEYLSFKCEACGSSKLHVVYEYDTETTEDERVPCICGKERFAASQTVTNVTHYQRFGELSEG